MTTQTKPWAKLEPQEKPLALAGMMGWTLHKPTSRPEDDFWSSTPWLTDYTACFEGPVAWAKAQGWEIEINCTPGTGVVFCYPSDDVNRATTVERDSPEAIWPLAA